MATDCARRGRGHEVDPRTARSYASDDESTKILGVVGLHDGKLFFTPAEGDVGVELFHHDLPALGDALHAVDGVAVWSPGRRLLELRPLSGPVELFSCTLGEPTACEPVQPVLVASRTDAAAET